MLSCTCCGIWGCALQDQELHSMIPVDPFQLRISFQNQNILILSANLHRGFTPLGPHHPGTSQWEL